MMMILLVMMLITMRMIIVIQVERTPLHTPSSPPLSSYAVAAPLLSSDEDEDDEDEKFVVDNEDEDDEDEKFVEDNDKEDFVGDGEECDPMSRWESTQMNSSTAVQRRKTWIVAENLRLLLNSGKLEIVAE